MAKQDGIKAMIADAILSQGTEHAAASMMSLAALAFGYLIDEPQLSAFTAYANEHTLNPDVTPEEMGVQLAMQGMIAIGLTGVATRALAGAGNLPDGVAVNDVGELVKADGES